MPPPGPSTRRVLPQTFVLQAVKDVCAGRPPRSAERPRAQPRNQPVILVPLEQGWFVGKLNER